MFEPRINPGDDPLGSPAPQSDDSATSSLTSLVRQILASRDAELRSAEMTLEIQLLHRKLELQRRYTASLNHAVEQALLALCRTPDLEAEHQRLAPSGGMADVKRKLVPDPPTNAPPREPSPPGTSVASTVPDAGVLGRMSGSSAGSGALSATDAEARADELLREATDILARAQESARQILERALSQGSEIVSRAEEQSNRLDEKMTEVEAVSAPSGATVYQRALELARRKGQAAAVSGPDVAVADGSSRSTPANAGPPAELNRLPGHGVANDSRRVGSISSADGGDGLSVKGVADVFGSAPGVLPGRADVHSTTVKISALKSFSQVVALEKAVRAIEGVIDVGIVSFRTGALELVVQHEPRVALDVALRALEGYDLRLVDSSGGRLWLEMAGG